MREIRPVIQYFKKHLRKFDILEKEFHHNPSVENVHDLRVESRRLLSLIQIFDIPVPHNLQKLVKRLGKLRDFDIGIINAHRFKLDDFELSRKREVQKTKLIKGTSKKLRHGLVQELEKAEGRLGRKKSSEVKALFRDFQKSLDKNLNVELNEENAHALRIYLKKVRYLLEALDRPMADLVKLQDLLGVLHDMEVLNGFFGHVPEIERKKQGLLKKAATAQRKLQSKIHMA